jgi:hypothetical protein
MEQKTNQTAATYRVSPALLLAQVLGPGFVFGCAVLFVSAGFIIGMFRYAYNWRHFSATYGFSAVSAAIALGLAVHSLAGARRSVSILRHAVFTNARIEHKYRLRTPKRRRAPSTDLWAFTVSCGSVEGETWEADCNAGFEGDELAEGDWIDAIYSRKDRSRVLLMPFIPGGPTLGEDAGTVVGFLMVGAFCLGLWLTAVFLPLAP